MAKDKELSPSRFEGGAFANFFNSLGAALLSIITLGIGFPWAVCMRQRWLTKNTVIDGRRLVFEGTGGQLFVKDIVWFLLTLITCGIYGFWLYVRVMDWIASNTHVAGEA